MRSHLRTLTGIGLPSTTARIVVRTISGRGGCGSRGIRSGGSGRRWRGSGCRSRCGGAIIGSRGGLLRVLGSGGIGVVEIPLHLGSKRRWGRV